LFVSFVRASFLSFVPPFFRFIFRSFFHLGAVLTPHVALVTAVTIDNDGDIHLTVQWFSRWGDLFPQDKRAIRARLQGHQEHPNEVFKTFDVDEVPAESLIGLFISRVVSRVDGCAGKWVGLVSRLMGRGVGWLVGWFVWLVVL